MKKHFASLDAMRGLAAVAVVLHHVDGVSVARGSFSFAPSGYLAVDLFFVISGFVICQSYQPRFGPDFGAWDYLKARVIRLYPLYLAGLVLSLPITVLAVGIGAGTWAGWSLDKLAVSIGGGALFLPTPPLAMNAGEYALYPWNVPFWSLFLELIASAAFLALRRLSPKDLNNLVVFSFVGLVFFAVAHGDADMGPSWSTFGGGLARVAFSFSVGMLLTHFEPVTWRGAPWVCFLVAPAALLLPVPPSLRQVYDLGCIGLLFPLAVWCGIGHEPRWRNLALFFGGASYALYALHEPVVRIIVGALRLKHLVVPGPVLAIACVCASLAVAAAAHRFYDEPVRRWLARLNRSAVGARRQAPAPQSAQL